MGHFHADSPENVWRDVIAKDGAGSTDRESSPSGPTFAMLSEGSHFQVRYTDVEVHLKSTFNRGTAEKAPSLSLWVIGTLHRHVHTVSMKASTGWLGCG